MIICKQTKMATVFIKMITLHSTFLLTNFPNLYFQKGELKLGSLPNLENIVLFHYFRYDLELFVPDDGNQIVSLSPNIIYSYNIPSFCISSKNLIHLHIAAPLMHNTNKITDILNYASFHLAGTFFNTAKLTDMFK